MTKAEQSPTKYEAGDLTLEQAAIFAEFFVVWTQRVFAAKPVAGVGLAVCA